MITHTWKGPTATGRRVAVAISGSGRSLANFLARQRPGQGYEIAAVIASRPDCKGVEIAAAHDLPTLVTTFTRANHAEATRAVYPWLEAHDISWIALAGFIRPFPIASGWEQRVVNIHPALLPRFGGRGMYGDHVHAAVLAAGEARSGASIHFVNEHYDEGSLIAQTIVPVQPNDTVQTLGARVFAAEQDLYPRVLDQLIAGELPHRDGHILEIDEEHSARKDRA